MTVKLLSCDYLSTPLWVFDELKNGATPIFTPFGVSGRYSPASMFPGFTGLRQDPDNYAYHAGNGYRSYRPQLRRFCSPDSLSPFAGAGINPYAYCAGDPINRRDPSGHLSAWAIFGIVLGAIGALLTGGAALSAIAAAGSVGAAIEASTAGMLISGGVSAAADVAAIASGATEEINPHAASILGWVSLGLGGVGLAFGARAFNSVFKRVDDLHDIKKINSNVEKQLTPEINRINIPRVKINNFPEDKVLSGAKTLHQKKGMTIRKYMHAMADNTDQRIFNQNKLELNKHALEPIGEKPLKSEETNIRVENINNDIVSFPEWNETSSTVLNDSPSKKVHFSDDVTRYEYYP